MRAMGLGIVRDLVAHAGPQRERAPILELRAQLALDAQEDVPLHAPMVREIARRVLHHAHTDPAELPRAPVGDPMLALVLGPLDLRPVGGAERDGRYFHQRFPGITW